MLKKKNTNKTCNPPSISKHQLRDGEGFYTVERLPGESVSCARYSEVCSLERGGLMPMTTGYLILREILTFHFPGLSVWLVAAVRAGLSQVPHLVNAISSPPLFFGVENGDTFRHLYFESDREAHFIGNDWEVVSSSMRGAD
jgi:hypothetical protein